MAGFYVALVTIVTTNHTFEILEDGYVCTKDNYIEFLEIEKSSQTPKE